MKKVILLFTAIVLSNCEVAPRKAVANIANNTHESYSVGYQKVVIDGMEYGIFNMNSGYTSPMVVNLTKDALEVELLRKQLR